MVPRPIEQTTSYALARTCKLLRARAHALFDEVGLHRGQQFVLGALWQREGCTQSELAQKLHVRPATITNMLQRMERAGLVTRRPDEGDLRVSRVHLTDAGREIRGPVERAWGDLNEQAFTGFSPEQRSLLAGFLHRIQENLAGAPAEYVCHDGSHR
jgi:DNA-binding MarR family transcriptional regulator